MTESKYLSDRRKLLRYSVTRSLKPAATLSRGHPIVMTATVLSDTSIRAVISCISAWSNLEELYLANRLMLYVDQTLSTLAQDVAHTYHVLCLPFILLT
ncbi:hypothetical protein PsorP6_004970 [Peronosclerospora sorghi]|uniref:Uncharacterized protein n=1 Tax=Peronosclerospora sorghi TaxID=230839 RepID=A0ACC0W6H5_9STRA|nr:hypothetical protein PsorP6_004970 [Peronosclerospora sorghi]